MRVVVSLTTLPSRVPYLPRILDNIRAQTFQPDAIYLNIPGFSKREKCQYDLSVLAPDDLRGVTVLTGSPDDGPITKLLPALDAEPRSADTFLVLVDDDNHYHPRCLETLLPYAENHAAIGATGRTAYTRSRDKSPVAFFPCHIAGTRPTPVLCLETWSMAMYRRDLFPDTADQMRQWIQTLPRDAFYVDDIVISAWIDRFTDEERWLVPVPWLLGGRLRVRMGKLPNPLWRNNAGLRGRNLGVLNELVQDQGYFARSVRCFSSSAWSVTLAILLIAAALMLLRFLTKRLAKPKQ